MIKNSHKFFANTDCRYYPCHRLPGDEPLNCLFCYCPLYFLPDCGGDFTVTDGGVRDCSACLKIHRPEGWEFVQRRLLRELRKKEE